MWSLGLQKESRRFFRRRRCRRRRRRMWYRNAVERIQGILCESLTQQKISQTQIVLVVFVFAGVVAKASCWNDLWHETLIGLRRGWLMLLRIGNGGGDRRGRRR